MISLNHKFLILKTKSGIKYINYIERSLEDVNSQNEESYYATTMDAAGALLKMLSSQLGNQNINSHVIDQSALTDKFREYKKKFTTKGNRKLRRRV